MEDKLNYIGKIKEALQEECHSPYIYTNRDVHDAWSIWQNKTNPKHRSLKPFSELTREVQDLDSTYRGIIIKVYKGGK